jgi:hypothetical protein
MKTIVKLVLGTAVLAAGVSAHAAIPLPSTGSSDLLFFVVDQSLGQTYTEVLNTTVGTGSALFNSGDAIANANPANLGVANVTLTGKAGFTYNAAANTNLQNFISANSADGLLWGVVGGVYTGSTLQQRQPIGNTLGVTTSSNDFAVANATESNLYDTVIPSTGLTQDITVINRATLDTFGGTNKGVIGTGTGADPNLTFYGDIATGEGNAIGATGVNLYGISTTGVDNGFAYGFNLGTITFDGSTLSFAGNSGTPTVPLPAAAWLFGSGLLGLLGIGRRRNLKAAA